MKLPRWLMAGMVTFILLSVLFVVCVGWVMWPAYTAEKLVDHIRNDETDKACAMVRSRDEQNDLQHIRTCNDPSVGALVARPRTWQDVLLGRGVFEFEHYHRPYFIVERGEIVEFQLGQPIFAFTVEFFR